MRLNELLSENKTWEESMHANGRYTKNYEKIEQKISLGENYSPVLTLHGSGLGSMPYNIEHGWFREMQRALQEYGLDLSEDDLPLTQNEMMQSKFPIKNERGKNMIMYLFRQYADFDDGLDIFKYLDSTQGRKV